MLPTTAERVSLNTVGSINRRLRRETEYRVRHYADHPEEIEGRLDELDREWDIERTLEAQAATVGIVGVGLGLFCDRRWLALPLLVSSFLLRHATHGWCPPLPVLRRLGVRTAGEIELERSALKALRGDFADTYLRPGGSAQDRARRALEAAAS